LDVALYKESRAKKELENILIIFKDFLRQRIIEGKLFNPITDESLKKPTLKDLAALPSIEEK
jgi:hypothetical protein